ncbi:MAG: AAA family ATPase [Dehalococcoidia bacterium]|nr:AAA family ATPase [Dehalococcoidia bacterium]
MRLINYRCFADAEITLTERPLLIGSNNAGKTSVLEAIDKVFGVGRRGAGYGFDPDDLARGLADGERLSVEIEIRPSTGDTFTEDEHALFDEHIDFHADGSELVLVTADAGFEQDGIFRSYANYYKLDGETDGRLDSHVHDTVNFFYLPAIRDARRELDERGGMWARLTDLLRQASDPEQLKEIATEAGRQLAEAVLGAERLEEMGDRVRSYVSAVLYGEDDAVSAEMRATPLDYRAVARRTSVYLTSPGEEDPISLNQYSTGVQTLAMFGLFRAYVETQGGMVLALGLEEPENHLSPHAVRSLLNLLSEDGTQIIYTTHSPVVADRFDPTNAILVRQSGRLSTFRAVPSGSFDEGDRAHLVRAVRGSTSEFLFGRSALLVEGGSEQGAFPEFAAQLGIDLDRLGVSIVGVAGQMFRPFVRLLSSGCLDLPHAAVCDRDLAVGALLRSLRDAGSLPAGIDIDNPDEAQLRQAGIFWWPNGDFEAYLVSEGGYPAFGAAANILYGDGNLQEYRERRTAQGLADDGGATVRGYVRQRHIRKPELASETARQFSVLGLPVPPAVREVLEFAAALAEAGMREAREPEA